MKKNSIAAGLFAAVLLLAGCGDIGDMTVSEAVQTAKSTLDEFGESAAGTLDSLAEKTESTFDTVNDLKYTVSEQSKKYEVVIDRLKEGDLSALEEIDLGDYRAFKVDADTFVSSFSKLLSAADIIETREHELGTAYIYTFSGKDGTPQKVIVVCTAGGQIAALSISRSIQDLNEIAEYVMEAAGVETNVDFETLMEGLPEEATFEKDGYCFVITEEFFTITMAAE